MNGDEHDRLWELLGRARRPAVSPFFARNVVRQIRLAQQERIGWRDWLVQSWRVAVPVAAAALVVLISFGTGSIHHPTTLKLQDAEIVDNPDYDVISHLDELVASEETALWTEPSAN